jgi:hypothetical protein
MDPSTAWLLFILTAIIHAFTFVVLQQVADHFKLYISALVGNAAHVNGVVSKGLYPMDTDMGNHRGTIPPNKKNDIITTMKYQQLHDTLDVSIFR